MRRALQSLIVTAMLVGACAPTNSTGTLPVEVLVVLDSTDNTLALVPVDSGRVEGVVSLGELDFVPRFVAARGELAVVVGTNPITLAGGAAIVDLGGRTVREVQLSLGAVSGVITTEDEFAWIAHSSSAIITRLDLRTASQRVVATPGGPQGFAAARGKVYAVIGNQLGCPPVSCDLGPSWLIQVRETLPRDSISLSGPGNAGAAVLGSDGLIYTLSPGPPLGTSESRLSVIDPVRGVEVAAFAGAGPAAGAFVASDGGERILIVTPVGGLMAFNTRDRRFTIPFGSGIPIDDPTDLATDALGRIYVTERGGCTDAAPGRIRVFKNNLIEGQSVRASSCPVAAAIAEVAADRLFGSTID